MYKLKIIAVGKIKEKFYTDACNEYLKRLSPFSKTDVIEVNEYKCNNDNPSQSEINKIIFEEGRLIASHIPQNYAVIPLCIEGKQLNSVNFSKTIDNFCTNGKSGICFIIGGSFGLSEQVKALADYKLSMSEMTFPHMLARVVLLEQVYRAMSILNNSKYHK